MLARFSSLRCCGRLHALRRFLSSVSDHTHYLVGMDEAGRGAVLGPMVACGVVVEKKNAEWLRALGVKDSKKLSPKRREELSTLIQKRTWIVVDSVQAGDIDQRRASGENLNEIEFAMFTNCLKTLLEKTNITKENCRVTIDLVGPLKYMEEHITREIPGLELNLLHKADTSHVEVAAASIVAKVHRDFAVKQLERHVGQPLGKGYPSCPIARQFIVNNLGNFPHNVVRCSWKTISNLEQEDE